MGTKKKIGPTIYRQGDVLLISTDREPSKLKKQPREAGRVVLAHGEVTGHAHAIDSRFCSLYVEDGTRSAPDMMTAISRLGGALIADRLLTCSKPVELKHEEHSTIKLPAGSYTVRIQREYHPEELRNVAD